MSCLGLIFGINNLPAQELRLNELMSSNSNLVFDEDGDTPDWMELNNFGAIPVDLGGYFLSDDGQDLQKWSLPTISLEPSQQLLIFASDKDRQQVVRNYYTPIDYGDQWRYLVPNQAVPADWKTLGFDDTSWLQGASGFGYGDEDDVTITPTGIPSIFLRKTFNLDDLQGLSALWLHIDYDDAFVAYLNGVEVARANIGTPGTTVPFDQISDTFYEAVLYQGLPPEAFNLSSMISLLQDGENVLAIQVHNFGSASSDLTAIPLLSLGYDHAVSLNEPLSALLDLPLIYPHTNFKLSTDGETIYLSHTSQGIIDSIEFGVIPGNYSFGRKIDEPDALVYFTEPTPGQPNGTISFPGIVQSEVHFSIEEAFLSSPQSLILSGAASDETIRYTLDGEDPADNSPEYETPIAIDENTVVRARIFKTGYLPGKQANRTYLFDQPHDLPVIMLNTAPANLWDEEIGIYVFGDDFEPTIPYYGANFWQDWERPAHIEMIEPSGERVFSLNSGIKIFGNWSRANDQKSFAVFFRNIYGDGALNYPLFEDKPISSFSSIVLRTSGNDWSRSKFRDGMMTSLVKNLDIDLQAYRPAVVYLNGEYWGIYNIREKVNEDFLEANHGIDADQIDIVENYGMIVEGSNTHYLDLLDFLENNDLALDANFAEAATRMDMSNFMDYQIAQIYFDNTDWPGNNIKYWRPQTPDGKWRWILYDTDFGFGLYSGLGVYNNTLEFATATDGPDWPNPPWSTFMLRTLLENTGFRHDFINRYADLLNTTFKGDAVKAHIDNLAQAVEAEIPRNFEQWPVSDIGFWTEDISGMKFFADMRESLARDHIQDKFNLPNQHEINLHIQAPDAGSIRLNTLTINQDNWVGIYFEEVPIQLTAVPYAGYTFDHWEVNGNTLLTESIEINLQQVTDITAYFLEGNEAVFPIVFNEINYNSPDDPDAGDWVELFNASGEAVDLSGWTFKDDDDSHEYMLPQATIMEAWSYLVLCQKVDNFTEVHPNVSNFLGEFDFGLGSSGDAVRLYDEMGTLVDSVSYGVSAPWPSAPNGTGATLELRHYNLDNSLPESWKASLASLGTPGQENSVVTGLNSPVPVLSKSSLKIFPNPFRSITNIQLKNALGQPSSLRIYTLAGQEVFQATSNSGEFQWNGTDHAGKVLSAGIYICKVLVDGQVLVGKVILKR
ncbi:MAG: hypothetical protein DHS20C18_37380 [Saprospiraceae bacterium]|nr:MAG: hypothetical protein DHS20C18_37380 [Saprospiraceae bacterium]